MVIRPKEPLFVSVFDTQTSTPQMAQNVSSPLNPLTTALAGPIERVGSIFESIKQRSPQPLIESFKKQGQQMAAKDPQTGLPNVVTQLATGGLASPKKAVGDAVAKTAKTVAPKVFKGFTDLSTKLLEKLKGRTTVSRQFIEDLTNSADLKQGERDLIRRVLGEESGQTVYRSGELRDGRKPLKGDWVSTTEDYAKAYSDRGALKGYTLRPDVKILRYEDLPANMKPYPSGTLQFDDFKDIQELQNKAYEYAKKRGYDAVGWGGKEINVINRDILTESASSQISVPDFANKVAEGQKTLGLREGQPPIGSDWNDATQTRINLEETVARERFDIPNLEKVSFGGSDRDVYLLPNGSVLKVAKAPRGLTQNVSSSDYYAEDAGLIPRTIEQGKNYVVKEFVGKPDENTKAMVNELKKLDVVSLMGKVGGNDLHQKEVQKAIDILNKYGYSGDDLMNYSPLWGDMTAIRNWGTRDGKPILLDEGTLNGDLVLNEIRRTGQVGRGNLSDPEFRDIYYQSRSAKKRFGDRDTKTMYGVGVIPFLSPQSREAQEKKNQPLFITK